MFPGLPTGPLNFVIFANEKENDGSWYYKLIANSRTDRANVALMRGMIVSTSNKEIGKSHLKFFIIFIAKIYLLDVQNILITFLMKSLFICTNRID